MGCDAAEVGARCALRIRLWLCRHGGQCEAWPEMLWLTKDWRASPEKQGGCWGGGNSSSPEFASPRGCDERQGDVQRRRRNACLLSWETAGQ